MYLAQILLWTLLCCVGSWAQGLNLPRKNYGRCSSEFNDVAFCRLLNDCDLFSEAERGNAQFRNRQKCASEENGSRLICCPIARTTAAPIKQGPVRCRTTSSPIAFCRPQAECNSQTIQSITDVVFGQSIECGAEQVCCPTQNVIKLYERKDKENSVCGLHLMDRLYGGSETYIGDYPWMALIAMQTFTGKQFKCGGTLIHDRWVITAAHCVNQYEPITGVRLGEWNTETNPDCVSKHDCADPHLDIDVDRVITHPEYQRSGIHPHDIALLRLITLVAFTAYIKPICLPLGAIPSDTILENLSATIAGWGYTESGKVSSIKLQGTLQTINLGACRQSLGPRYTSIDTNKLCAYGHGNVSSCQGDSGGPVMYDHGGFYLIGIISLGSANCVSKTLPMMLTRVKPYVTWIEETINYEQ